MATIDRENLEKLIRDKPFWALNDHVDLLTDEQIMRCVERVSNVAIMDALDFLKPEHIELYCQTYPKSAIMLGDKLTKPQLDFCCEREPEAALREAMSCAPYIKLDSEQFDRCLHAVPPAIALELAPENLGDKFCEYARSAPTEALKHASHYMNGPMLEEFALNDPATALEFADNCLGDNLRKLCAEAAPKAALRWVPHLLAPPQLEKEALEDPATALNFANDCLDDRLRKLCAVAAPRAALAWVPHLLDREMLEMAASEDPVTALECAYHCLDEELRKFCANAAPDRGLIHAPHLLDPTLLADAALRDPDTALMYAHASMDDSLFMQLAENLPWKAVRFATDRINDEDLIRYISENAFLTIQLLETSPDHHLTSRLLKLHRHLEPDVANAVSSAIAKLL
jgi:hypothetical protein